MIETKDFEETDALIAQWDAQIADDRAGGFDFSQEDLSDSAFANVADTLPVLQYNQNHGYHGRFSSGGGGGKGGAGHVARLRAKVRSLGQRMRVNHHVNAAARDKATAERYRPGGEEESRLKAETAYHAGAAALHTGQAIHARVTGKDAETIAHHEDAAASHLSQSTRSAVDLHNLPEARAGYQQRGAAHTAKAAELRTKYGIK